MAIARVSDDDLDRVAEGLGPLVARRNRAQASPDDPADALAQQLALMLVAGIVRQYLDRRSGRDEDARELAAFERRMMLQRGERDRERGAQFEDWKRQADYTQELRGRMTPAEQSEHELDMKIKEAQLQRAGVTPEQQKLREMAAAARLARGEVDAGIPEADRSLWLRQARETQEDQLREATAGAGAFPRDAEQHGEWPGPKEQGDVWNDVDTFADTLPSDVSGAELNRRIERFQAGLRQRYPLVPAEDWAGLDEQLRDRVAARLVRRQVEGRWSPKPPPPFTPRPTVSGPGAPVPADLPVDQFWREASKRRGATGLSAVNILGL